MLENYNFEFLSNSMVSLAVYPKNYIIINLIRVDYNKKNLYPPWIVILYNVNESIFIDFKTNKCHKLNIVLNVEKCCGL